MDDVATAASTMASFNNPSSSQPNASPNVLPSFAQTFPDASPRHHPRDAPHRMSSSSSSDSAKDDHNAPRHYYNLPPIRPITSPSDKDKSLSLPSIEHDGRASSPSRSSRKRTFDVLDDRARPPVQPESSLRYSWTGSDGERPHDSARVAHNDVPVKQETAEPSDSRHSRSIQQQSPQSHRRFPSPSPRHEAHNLSEVVSRSSFTPQPPSLPGPSDPYLNQPVSRKKRRVTISGSPHPSHPYHPESSQGQPLSPAVIGFSVPPESVDQVRNALNLKHQQKALIEQRKSASGSVDANQEPRPLKFRTMQSTDDGNQRPGPESPLSALAVSPSQTHPKRTSSPPWSVGAPSSSMSGHQSNSAYADADSSNTSILARRRGNPSGQKAPTPTTLTVQTGVPISSLDLPAIRSAPPLSRTLRNQQQQQRTSGPPYQLPPLSLAREGQLIQPPISNTRRPLGPPGPESPQSSIPTFRAAPSDMANIPGPRNIPLHQPGFGGYTHRRSVSPGFTLGPSSSRHHARPQGPSNSHVYPQYPNEPSRSSFLSLFDSFYEALHDSRRLKFWLDEQVRRYQNLEALVDERVNHAREESRSEVEELRRRIEALESAAAASNARSPDVITPGASIIISEPSAPLHGIHSPPSSRRPTGDMSSQQPHASQSELSGSTDMETDPPARSSAML